jgi:bifunctional non-homologous end joining protein LigD
MRDGLQEIAGRTFEITNADKVLFPDTGLTKGDLIDHHLRAADLVLPHLAGRPVALRRFPNGIEVPGFFQKAASEHYPDWIPRVPVEKREGGTVEHVQVDEAATLAYLVQQGTIELHPWLSRSDDLERPDQLVIDLDPPEGDIDAARAAARSVRDLLQEIGIEPRLKTTGSSGYHVHVELDRSETFDAARDLAGAIAHALARRHPDELTAEQRKDARGDRVFVDWLRNGFGQTAVAAYTVRALPGAPVATPIAWDELGSVDPGSHTVSSIFRRLGQRDDPWADVGHAAVNVTWARERLREIEDG